MVGVTGVGVMTGVVVTDVGVEIGVEEVTEVREVTEVGVVTGGFGRSLQWLAVSLGHGGGENVGHGWHAEKHL
jgi:hypothetical protein